MRNFVEHPLGTEYDTEYGLFYASGNRGHCSALKYIGSASISIGVSLYLHMYVRSERKVPKRKRNVDYLSYIEPILSVPLTACY